MGRGHLDLGLQRANAGVEKRLPDAVAARLQPALDIDAHQQTGDAGDHGRREAGAGGSAKTAADAGAWNRDTRRQQTLRALTWSPVAADERGAVVGVGSDGEDAWNGGRDRIAGASLVAGGGDNEHVACAGLLEGLAQVARQRQQIGLLRGADIDDVGVPLQSAADPGCQIALRAHRLLRACRRGGKDRDRNHLASRGDAGDDGIAGAGDDRIDVGAVLDDAAGREFCLGDRRGVDRSVQDGDHDLWPALGDRPQAGQTRQSGCQFGCNILVGHGAGPLVQS